MVFEVHDADSISLGYCLSPIVARFNHSCRPSAFVALPFGTQVEKPLRVIALDAKGEAEEVSPRHHVLVRKES
jgi:hypothetical protein